jgi:SAM-dependent MidA family methyltransferase
MSTPLAEKIKAIILSSGPISLTDYFALCLADPEYGYYRTREPFGQSGDFITAPEISQLFGELIGMFLFEAWRRHGEPANVLIAEIGPGRGTMMADILRVLSRLSPALYEIASVHLVETSERLQKVQSQTLVAHKFKITWHDSFEDVPDGFLLLVANELFDAIPIRQFVKTELGFRERMVGLDADDNLCFAAGVATIDPDLLPAPGQDVPVGTIFEVAPARDAVMAAIASRLKRTDGSALIIDYGHMATNFGETLQAIRAHQFDPPLAHPGEADITSHVDFEQLARRAVAEGLRINGLTYQGDFLLAMGITERAEALARGKDLIVQEGIRQDAERLAGSGEGKMGDLFKVLAVSHPPVALVPFQQ